MRKLWLGRRTSGRFQPLACTLRWSTARPGAVVTIYRQPFAVTGFTNVEGRIAAIADPERVRRIAAAVLAEE